MSGLRVDASEVVGFATRMGAAPGLIRQELARTTTALAVVGVGLAQEFAPVDEGILRANITLLSSGGLEASYGVRGLVYARQREEGGEIRPRRAKYLVFYWKKKGRWIATKRVFQWGSHYMFRSVEALRERADGAYGAALDRIIARIGG